MKIRVYYEDKNSPIHLDITDQEALLWVETDYQRRLAEAGDKSRVKRRTAQEIMDADYNKPTFNNNHAETRRHVSLQLLDPDGQHIPAKDSPQSCPELYAAIKKLRPKQRELVRKVFFEGVSQREIAAEEGVTEAAISDRMSRIYARLKKNLAAKKLIFKNP